MIGLALCNKGIEEIVSLDIKEILRKKSIKGRGHVTFQFEKEDELCKLAYISQSISKVILVLDSFEFKSQKKIIEQAGKLQLKWFNKDRKFKVDAKVIESDIEQEEIRGEIGEAIINSLTDYEQKVDLSNPDITIYIYINRNKAHLGIDFTGKSLSKRSYRIFSSPRNIKSTIAYAMVRLSGYKKEETLIDPFCISGSIGIEAALFNNNLPVRYFDKEEFLFNKFIKFDFKDIDKKSTKIKSNIYALDSLFKNINASKKNAKIANVNKLINFSRTEIDWLDTKFDKENVDRIVTCIPNITKYTNENELLKVYNEFFHQAEFILKKKGIIVICTTNPEKIKESSKERFELEMEKEVWQGKEKLVLLKLSKK